MIRAPSPTADVLELPAGHAPPTPPQSNQLDDIYGSAPVSPVDTSIQASNEHEILSDLPARQRLLDTDAYREGLTNSKGKFIQQGFDEGYSLGANLGLVVGYILGVLQTMAISCKDTDVAQYITLHEDEIRAKNELSIQVLLGQQWINEDGIWKWDVRGDSDQITFDEVAKQHPVLIAWIARVDQLAAQSGFKIQSILQSQET